MMWIWAFIQNQILGMQWLSVLVSDLLIFVGLDINNKFVSMLHFFIYDTIKIFVLLCSLIFLISYIQSYFPPERSKKILGKYRGMKANIIGALLGTVTPFCSCSSIPIFMGFASAGLPLGVIFSFLISSPMVDLGSIVLLTSIFGPKIAITYTICGLIIAIIGGTLIEKMHLEDQIEDFLKQIDPKSIGADCEVTYKQRLSYAKTQVIDIVKRVAPYIFIGVGIGAIIHNLIPAMWIETLLGSNNPFSVIIATFVGIPIYADIFGTIPVAESLLSKGAGLGTVLSFMMAVTTLSLPSLILLRKVVKPKLLTIFVIIVSMGIIIIGYLFNYFQHIFF